MLSTMAFCLDPLSVAGEGALCHRAAGFLAEILIFIKGWVGVATVAKSLARNPGRAAIDSFVTAA
ncbi:MAG: hypothetical protein GC191_08820 [Azospirillum sp.]|nr:hypothetical protein [Azospirillum sp.]